MKVNDLYNPKIEGTQYQGFIKAVDSIKPITGNWINPPEPAEDEPEPVTIDVDILDNYIKLQMGKRGLYEDFAEISTATYSLISDIFTTNAYKLNQLWKTLFSTWDPIENYDRYEDIEDKTKNEFAKVHSTTDYGEKVSTNSGTNSPLDSSLYSAKTDETQIKDEAAQDEFTTDARTDNITNNHTAHIHGNIGVMTGSAMMKEFRETVAFNFYDEIVKLLYDYITTMNFEEV